MPPTYLRFTPSEYRALARACRTFTLAEDSFPAFRWSLAMALTQTAPGLADRVSHFHSYQAGILFEYLKQQRGLDGRQPVPLPEPLRQRCGWAL